MEIGERKPLVAGEKRMPILADVEIDLALGETQ